METLLDPQHLSKRPPLPTRIVAGCRVEIGEVRRDGSDWTWRRSVLRKPKDHSQAHWVWTRNGWSVSRGLWAQVRSHFRFVEFMDEDGGRWVAPAKRLDALKKPLGLPNLEEPHWLLPAEAWDYAPPPAAPLQLPLFTGAPGS